MGKNETKNGLTSPISGPNLEQRRVRNIGRMRKKSPLIYLKKCSFSLFFSSFRNFHEQNKIPDNLTKDEFAALKTLASNNNIIIQKADKGNAIVIIDRKNYIDRMNDILADATKFLPFTIPGNNHIKYAEQVEKKIRNSIKDLHQRGILSKREHDEIYPKGSRPGKLYGLSKIHKPPVNGCPKFRPILSALGTATYHLSKFLVPIMSPITTNNTTVKDSFSFAKEIIEQDSTLFMASLDVEALFTSIPLDQTIDIAADTLFSNTDTVSKLNKAEFKELLLLATKESWFQFNDHYYKQTDGVAMGNPLGPTMANIFMCFFEKQWIDTCPAEFKPVFYRRYVDDIFVLFKNPDHIKQFKDYLNGCHPNIKFTDEIENDDKLPFLDVNVCRQNGSFSTTIYRKSSFTGLYSNFKSLVPPQFKKGLIFTLLHRLFTLCSSWVTFDIELSRLKSILIRNGYPVFFIDKCVSIFLEKIHLQQPNNNNNNQDDRTELYITLPFLGKFSLQIRKQIVTLLKKNIPSCRVKFLFKTKRRLSHFFKFKDTTPKCLQSHLVYKLQCNDCNVIYYGLAERHSKVRAYDHLGLSYLTEKPIKGVDTAMKSHCRQKGHSISWDNLMVIAREENSFHLHIKESLLIKRDKPFLNKQLYSTPLYLF